MEMGGLFNPVSLSLGRRAVIDKGGEVDEEVKEILGICHQLPTKSVRKDMFN